MTQPGNDQGLAAALAQPLDDFIRYLAAEKRHAAHTCSSYQDDLRRFGHWVAGAESRSAWRELSSHDLRRYVAVLSRSGLSGRSIARHLSAIRRFYDYLLREHQATDNPVLDVRAPRAAHRLPRVSDVDQLSHLLDATPEDALETRDLSMFELIYSSGLRLSELAGLDLYAIDRRGGEVRVLGKGGKERILPVGQRALQALDQWLDVRPTLATDREPALFVSRRGERLSNRSIQSRLRRWGVKNGADQRLHPHLLRHSFASHMLESSGDLRAVQELLGHADISTTQIYTHLDFQHLAKVYDQSHPRARRERK
jgi:integrase/recombinase XerC